jgi:hypothetical protein
MEIPELNGYNTVIFTGAPSPLAEEGGQFVEEYVLPLSRFANVSLVADPEEAVSVTFI